MNFDQVYMVFDSMHLAFHPSGDFDDPDPRLQALWTLFLCSVGWTSDEFWATLDSENGDDMVCEDCEIKNTKVKVDNNIN